MRRKNPESNGGFTLLELVVVLAILAIVTALATREISYVQDQQRFEVSQRGLQEIQEAVLGSPDDRLPDGTLSGAGFVADMGRLPRTIASGTNFTLAELWSNPGTLFDLRAAVVSNGVDVTEVDAQVLVPGGWRGPYIRLPLGADTLNDGWGNAYSSPIDPAPSNPEETGYARLRDATDHAIVTAGQEIRLIRHLGANGRCNAADTGYDRDVAIEFPDAVVLAALKGQVEVLNGDSPASVDPADRIIVRAFGPDPTDAAKIKVWSTTVIFLSNPIVWELPAAEGLTIGPRVIRAYFVDVNGNGTSLFSKSAVKSVTLRPGVNPLNLTIDR
jgi:prepilin-type N-terminal cleavage/methylation domain-containing protein